MILSGDMTVNGFQMLLLTHGVKCYGRVLGYTARDRPAYSDLDTHDKPDRLTEITINERGEQIYEWVRSHGVERFVALDDLQLGIQEHYQVNSKTGLTSFDVDEVVKLIS